MALAHSFDTCLSCTAQAFCGWLYGQFPPGLLANFKLAGQHLLNMFRAHTAAYNAIKELPGALLYFSEEQQLLTTPILFNIQAGRQAGSPLPLMRMSQCLKEKHYT